MRNHAILDFPGIVLKPIIGRSNLTIQWNFYYLNNLESQQGKLIKEIIKCKNPIKDWLMLYKIVSRACVFAVTVLGKNMETRRDISLFFPLYNLYDHNFLWKCFYFVIRGDGICRLEMGYDFVDAIEINEILLQM